MKLIPPNGVLLSGIVRRSSDRFRRWSFCVGRCGGRRFGPVLHGVVPFGAGLGPSNEAFEVSRRVADTAERLKGTRCGWLMVGVRACRFGLDLVGAV